MIEHACELNPITLCTGNFFLVDILAASICEGYSVLFKVSVICGTASISNEYGKTVIISTDECSVPKLGRLAATIRQNSIQGGNDREVFHKRLVISK